MNANPKLFRNFRQNITASTPTTLQIPQALNNFTKENCVLEKIGAKLNKCPGKVLKKRERTTKNDWSGPEDIFLAFHSLQLITSRYDHTLG